MRSIIFPPLLAGTSKSYSLLMGAVKPAPQDLAKRLVLMKIDEVSHRRSANRTVDVGGAGRAAGLQVLCKGRYSGAINPV